MLERRSGFAISGICVAEGGNVQCGAYTLRPEHGERRPIGRKRYNSQSEQSSSAKVFCANFMFLATYSVLIQISQNSTPCTPATMTLL